jgi:hemin uptake protein HemP
MSVGHFFYAHIVGFNMKVITNLTAKEHMNFDVAIVAEQKPNCDIKLSRIKRLNTEQLFTDVKEVMIEHLNETYVLRITKQNKLILTK